MFNKTIRQTKNNLIQNQSNASIFSTKSIQPISGFTDLYNTLFPSYTFRLCDSCTQHLQKIHTAIHGASNSPRLPNDWR